MLTCMFPEQKKYGRLSLVTCRVLYFWLDGKLESMVFTLDKLESMVSTLNKFESMVLRWISLKAWLLSCCLLHYDSPVRFLCPAVRLRRSLVLVLVSAPGSWSRLVGVLESRYAIQTSRSVSIITIISMLITAQCIFWNCHPDRMFWFCWYCCWSWSCSSLKVVGPAPVLWIFCSCLACSEEVATLWSRSELEPAAWISISSGLGKLAILVLGLSLALSWAFSLALSRSSPLSSPDKVGLRLRYDTLLFCSQRSLIRIPCCSERAVAAE